MSRVLIAVLVGLSTGPTVAFAFAEPAAVETYRSLANAVDEVEGVGFAELNPGDFRAQHAGLTMVWSIPNGTKADFSFRYKDSFIDYLSIDFDNTLIIVMDNPRLKFKLTHLSYDERGSVLSTDLKIVDEASLKNAPRNTLARVMRALQANLEAESLFKGDPVSALASARRLEPDGKPGKLTVHPFRRLVFKNKEEMAGLKVKLKSGVDVWFSSQNSSHKNFVTLKGSATVVFDKLDYLTDESFVDGRLREFDCQVKRGHLEVGDLLLDLQEGSKLLAGDLKFSYSAERRSGSVESRYGSIEARLGRGSRFSISSANQGDAFLQFDDGTAVVLKNVVLDVNDNKPSGFQCSAGSSFTGKVFDSRLGFGSRSYLFLRNGSVASRDIQARWDYGSKPDVKATLTSLTLNAGEGSFTLPGKGSTLNVEGGHLAAIDLKVDSSNSMSITGAISDLELDFKPSSLNLSDKLSLSTDGTGKFRSTDMSLVPDSEYPIGRFVLEADLDSISASGMTGSRGHAVLRLIADASGKVFSPDRMPNGEAGLSSLKGTALRLPLSIPSSPRTKQSVTVNVQAFSITEAKLSSQGHLSGTVGGSIAAFSIIYTNDINGPPLKIGAQTLKDVIMYPIDFTIDVTSGQLGGSLAAFNITCQATIMPDTPRRYRSPDGRSIPVPAGDNDPEDASDQAAHEGRPMQDFVGWEYKEAFDPFAGVRHPRRDDAKGMPEFLRFHAGGTNVYVWLRRWYKHEVELIATGGVDGGLKVDNLTLRLKNQLRPGPMRDPKKFADGWDYLIDWSGTIDIITAIPNPFGDLIKEKRQLILDSIAATLQSLPSKEIKIGGSN